MLGTLRSARTRRGKRERERTPVARRRLSEPRRVRARAAGVALRALVVLRRKDLEAGHARVHLGADREAEAEEERVDERVAEAHGAGDDVARGELERAAEDDEALDWTVSYGCARRTRGRTWTYGEDEHDGGRGDGRIADLVRLRQRAGEEAQQRRDRDPGIAPRQRAPLHDEQ